MRRRIRDGVGRASLYSLAWRCAFRDNRFWLYFNLAKIVAVIKFDCVPKACGVVQYRRPPACKTNAASYSGWSRSLCCVIRQIEKC